MSTEITLPAGAPEEVVTQAFVRDIDLAAFGGKGSMALITLDNGHDHNRPNTFGQQSLKAFDLAITEAIGRNPEAIGITGKPFIFAAGADLSGISFLTERSQSLAFGKLGHDVFRRLGESKIPVFSFINGLALGGGLEVGLHSHYRTLSSTALTGLPEVFLGLIPGWGGATILPKLIGPERAVQVIMLNALNNNTMMKAKDALKLGVVDAVFDPADFLERSIGFAVGVLNGTTKIERADHSNDPGWDAALATGKAAALKKYGGATIAAPKKALDLITAAQTCSLSQGFDAEDQALGDLTMSDPLRSSLYAFNLIQKKRKKVEGAPKPALARKVTKVGVVGAG
jgi:enoyl-CoA hydratase/carnithine racemase